MKSEEQLWLSLVAVLCMKQAIKLPISAYQYKSSVTTIRNHMHKNGINLCM